MAEATREVVFDLPEDLIKKYNKKEYVVDVDSSLPESQQLEIAQQAFDDWYLNETTLPSQLSYSQPEQIGIPTALYRGAEKGIGDIAMGVRQGVLQAQRTNPLMAESPEQLNQPVEQQLQQLSQEQLARESDYEQTRQKRPIASAIGEALPFALTRSPLTAGITEALKYGQPGERVTRGALGGLGALGGNIIGRNLSGYVNPQLSNQQMAAIRNAESLGVNPRLSELTGSSNIANLEDVIAQSPFGGRVLQAQSKNQQRYNEAAAKSIGMEANELSDDVLANARNQISSVYRAVATLPEDVAPIRFGKKIENASNKILSRKTTASKMNMPEIENNQLFDMAESWKNMAKSGDFFTGADYAITRENLSNLAWAAEGSEKIAYRDLLNALDDAAEESLTKAGLSDLTKNLKTARTQYSNLKTLEKGNVIKNGDVDIKALRNALKQGKESAYREGLIKSDLAKLSKYSEATQPIREGSQTAKRGFYQELMQNPLTAIPMSLLNAVSARAITSPALSYAPAKLGGTQLGNVTGNILERGAKVPAIALEQELLTNRLLGRNRGLLEDNQSNN
jgi:hypothetical protein